MRLHLLRALAAAAPIGAASPAGAQRSHSANELAMLAVHTRVDGEDVVRTARQYLGVRYSLGGTTPRAFDCSGFVRYVFGHYGVSLPRTAHEQAAVGEAPMPGDLRAGDLLFFYGGRGAQHIAIYVGGDTIIHASSGARRVRLDRISRDGRRSWFNRRLIAVRRVLPADGVYYLPTADGGPDDVVGAVPPRQTRSVADADAVSLPR